MPITADDLAIQIGCSKEEIQETIEVCLRPDIRWLDQFTVDELIMEIESNEPLRKMTGRIPESRRNLSGLNIIQTKQITIENNNITEPNSNAFSDVVKKLSEAGVNDVERIVTTSIAKGNSVEKITEIFNHWLPIRDTWDNPQGAIVFRLTKVPSNEAVEKGWGKPSEKWQRDELARRAQEEKQKRDSEDIKHQQKIDYGKQEQAELENICGEKLDSMSASEQWSLLNGTELGKPFQKTLFDKYGANSPMFRMPLLKILLKNISGK